MKKPVILCVDDEKIILDSLKDQLQKHFANKFNIETAESGLEAIDVLKELKAEGVEIPLVISDHIMPHMKGDILLIIVHSLLPETKKILLTGQTTREEIINAVNNANLYRFISKPWDEEDLALTVKIATKSYFDSKNLESQNTRLRKIVSELSSKKTALVHMANENKLQLSHSYEEENKSLKDLKIDMNPHISDFMLLTEIITSQSKDLKLPIEHKYNLERFIASGNSLIETFNRFFEAKH